MNVKISDLLILSDVDGTLYREPTPICTRNIEAIIRFTKKGGRFALATGRSIQSAAQFTQQLPISAPCILFNGAGVYDYAKKKILAAHYLPDFALAYIRIIADAFPNASAILFGEQSIRSVGHSEYMVSYLADENKPVISKQLELTENTGWFKAIFSISGEEMPSLQAFIAEQGWNDVAFVASAPFFYEMLPFNISKATGLQHISELIHIPIEQIVAIGDYYNDEAMLRASGIPVTVAGAPDDIKQICRYVTGSCEEGALADLIEYLERCCE